MKKSLINYLAFSLALFVAMVLIVTFLTSDDEEKETTTEVQVVTTTTAPISTAPIPTYVEDATSQQIPNPCETVSIENVDKYVENAIVRGPQFQSAIAPVKGCIWIGTGESPNRLGVAIVLAPNAFTAAETTKTKDVTVGEKAFISDGFNATFQNSTCGQTLYVYLRGFSYSVSYCSSDNTATIEKTLIELANGVGNSLP